MTTSVNTLGINLQVSDVTGQKVRNFSGIDPQASVGELIEALTTEMNLPRNDGVIYSARLERDGGRQLNASELVADALQDEDRIQLEPDIEAGRD